MSAADFAAVVFDLDGTLADTLPDVVGALNRLLMEDGLRYVTYDEGRNLVGEGARSLIERAYMAIGRPLERAEIDLRVERFIGLYRRDPVVGTRLYPGVREVLGRLYDNGVKLGICTNKPHEMALVVLERLDLASYFGSVIGAGVLAVRKPDPRHLLAVIDRLAVAREACVYVGDSPVDVETARNAEIPVVVMSCGYSRVPAAELGADAVVDSFGELPAAFAGLRHEMRQRATP